MYLKPERLTKRSSPDDLQLKIKIIYDYSVDQSVLQLTAFFYIKFYMETCGLLKVDGIIVTTGRRLAVHGEG